MVVVPGLLPVPDQHLPSHQQGERWFPLLLLLLALLDLRTEVLLLIDHFTFTSIGFAIRHHLLAVVVLAAFPSLWRRYGSSRRC